MFTTARLLIALAILNTTQASLYVIFPVHGSTCAVLQPCQIKWKDDSKPPLTSTFGDTSIDLVMGNSSNLQSVQTLGGVSDPSVATALTFTPIAGLSPTQQYAIRFIFKGNQSNPIFSTFFSITGGSGTAKPLTNISSSTTSSSPMSSSQATNASQIKGASRDSTTSTSNQTASGQASQSGASSINASPALAFVICLCALLKFL